MHESGDTAPRLQVRVSRVLQEDTQDGEVAVVRSSHERGVAKAALQVDARASLQQLRDDLNVRIRARARGRGRARLGFGLAHLKVAVGCGGVQEGEGCGLPVTC